MVVWNSPSPIQPAKGYAAMIISSTNIYVVPVVANTLSTFRLSHFGKKLPADIVNASSMKSFKTLLGANWQPLFPEVPNLPTVRLLTHVLCKPTHFFFHSFIATMSCSLQTSFHSLMKDWADKYHVWGTPTRSPSRSNSR